VRCDVVVRGPGAEQALDEFVALVLSDCVELSDSAVYFIEEVALEEPPAAAMGGGGSC
jgi:hypothetical protein